MIDVRPLTRAIDGTPGDVMQVEKAQLRTMLAEIALGNAARCTLAQIGSIARVQPGVSAS